jgi:hypothetical protein
MFKTIKIKRNVTMQQCCPVGLFDLALTEAGIANDKTTDYEVTIMTKFMVWGTETGPHSCSANVCHCGWSTWRITTFHDRPSGVFQKKSDDKALEGNAIVYMVQVRKWPANIHHSGEQVCGLELCSVF